MLVRKKKNKEDVAFYINKTEAVTTGMEKPEVLSIFFSSVVTGDYSSHISEVSEPQGRECPIIRAHNVQDHLRKLNLHKSIGPNEMLSKVPRELADIVADPLYIIFEKAWQSGKLPSEWSKRSIRAIFKKG